MDLPVWSGVAGAEVDEDPRLAGARRRWRAAGDRLWPVALSDGTSYQQVAEIVGTLVGVLRERVGTLGELVELDASPTEFLAASGAAGQRAAAQPELLAAACAVRADELVAERSRRRRAERIAEARAGGRAWVEIDRSATRVAEMHVASGATIVATADPFLGDEPFRIAEMVLDTVTGDPLAGPDGDDAVFAGAAEWEAERERRRREISGRLDRRDRDGSDR